MEKTTRDMVIEIYKRFLADQRNYEEASNKSKVAFEKFLDLNAESKKMQERIEILQEETQRLLIEASSRVSDGYNERKWFYILSIGMILNILIGILLWLTITLN